MARRRRKTPVTDQAMPSPEIISIVGMGEPKWSATVSDMLENVVESPAVVQGLTALGFKSKNPGGMTFKEAIIASQISNAVRGDLQSYRSVMDYAEKGQESSPLLDFVKSNYGE